MVTICVYRNGVFTCADGADVGDADDDEIYEERSEEITALEAIYGDKFTERITNRVWTISLDIPKLTELARDQTAGLKQRENIQRRLMDASVCPFYLKGRCKFGGKCKYKHEMIYKQADTGVSEDDSCDFQYQLEIRFPHKNRYPLDVPFIAFQSTNTLLNPHVALNITARLTEEAKQQSQYQLPVVFTLVSLLESDEEVSDLFCMPPARYVTACTVTLYSKNARPHLDILTYVTIKY